MRHRQRAQRAWGAGVRTTRSFHRAHGCVHGEIGPDLPEGWQADRLLDLTRRSYRDLNRLTTVRPIAKVTLARSPTDSPYKQI